MTTYMNGHTATTTEHTTSPKPRKGGCGCGGECGCKRDSCCGLTCFERPNYFCGHLLTDADLSLEQKYLVEKNKLYHRAIDGHGVVCGLRLTCDRDCPGYIDVGEGYAIDDCGNDLVVCDSRRVHVLKMLKDKGWVADGPAADPCKPGAPPDDCPMKQCFRVAVCYDEEPAEFTTPFSASCGAAPAACEPTRIRERVRFEVLQDCDDDEKALGPFERAELQMERCYAFLSRGPIANKISENDALITVAIRGEAKPPSEKQPNRFFDLFCQLRILFLQYLRSNPDRYDCALEENIRALNWPNATANSYGSDVKTVYTSLLGAMQSHAYNCILNELVFSCDEPSKACCVVLGSVEVVNGRITRVCNLPRQYVWTPANFANVLLFDLLTQRKQKRTLDKEWAAYDRASNQATPAPEKSCCPEIPFDAELFLRRHTLSSRYGVMAAHAAIFGLREFYSALGRSFDFTDLTRVSSQPAMQAESPEKMARVARELELDETIVKADFVAEPNPIQMLLAHTLKEARSPMAIYDRQTAGLNAEAWPSYVRSQSLDYQPLKEMELDLARAVDRQQPPPQTPPPAAPPTPPPPPPAAPPTTPAPSGQQAGADTAPAQSAPAQSAPAQAAPAQPAATQPAATPSTPSDARVLMKAMAAPRPRRRGLKKGEPQ